MSEWNAETAEWYAAKYGEYATNRLAADAIDLAPDAVVVDVGCGTGSALRRIAPRVPNGTLIGLEPVPRMLEIARDRAKEDPNGFRIQFEMAPAERIPLGNETADVVLAFDSIDHWQDKAKGLREVRRLLRPRGRLIVVKDGGLPGRTEAKRRFLAELARAGLEALQERELSEDDVTCTMWVCSIRSTQFQPES